MRSIMLVNAKGGCGKSTLATNLASFYATRGKNVTLADMDPQGSSYEWVNNRPEDRPGITAIAGWKEPLRPSRGGAANQWFRAVLREGRKREVRRMFEAVGLQVSRLVRVRFGDVRLPRTLQPGQWTELGRAHCAALLAGGVDPALSEVVRESNSC